MRVRFLASLAIAALLAGCPPFFPPNGNGNDNDNNNGNANQNDNDDDDDNENGNDNDNDNDNGDDGPPVAPSNVLLPAGYFMETVKTGFDYPTGVAWNGERWWVAEAGHLPMLEPRVKTFTLDGDVEIILQASDFPSGELLGPLNDITFHDGWLYISHREVGVNGWFVGAISRFRPNDPIDTFETILTDLPSAGDHGTNEIIFSDNGRMYFAQGTATNSGIVGPDNDLVTGWLNEFPDFHDFAPVDLTLSGLEVVTPVAVSRDPQADDFTPPFMRFIQGTVLAGDLVAAATPDDPQQGVVIGNGTVYSGDPDADDVAATLELEAWGLRNPYGLKIDPFQDGVLFATNNGADIRTAEVGGDLMAVGSRPIANDFDDMFRVNVGGEAEFFGWPDYFHDPITLLPLPVTDPLFCVAFEAPLMMIPCPEFLLLEAFRDTLDVRPAFAQFELHGSANKFDLAPSNAFRFRGDFFVPLTGGFAPLTGVSSFRGYKIVRVDRDDGLVYDFITQAGMTTDTILNPDGFNKPLEVAFRRDVMLIVDFGVFEPELMRQRAGSGKIWAVAHGRSGLTRLRNTIDNEDDDDNDD